MIFKALLIKNTVRRLLMAIVEKNLTWEGVTTCIAERLIRVIIVVAINDIIGNRRVSDRSSFCFCFFFWNKFDDVVDGFLVDIGRGWLTWVRLLTAGLGLGLGWFAGITLFSPLFPESGTLLLWEGLNGLPVFRLTMLLMWRWVWGVVGFRLGGRLPFGDPCVACAIEAAKCCLNLLVIVVVVVRLWDRRVVFCQTRSVVIVCEVLVKYVFGHTVDRCC